MTCHRGHDLGRDSTGECAECRRIRQRIDRFKAIKNLRRRRLANQKDVQRIQEVLDAWAS